MTAADVFAAMVALRGEIAFGHLAEGCECRSQLMIEAMLGLGVTPGRAWVLTVPGRQLIVPDGFWLDADPPEGATAVARDRMRKHLDAEARPGPGG